MRLSISAIFRKTENLGTSMTLKVDKLRVTTRSGPSAILPSFVKISSIVYKPSFWNSLHRINNILYLASKINSNYNVFSSMITYTTMSMSMLCLVGFCPKRGVNRRQGARSSTQLTTKDWLRAKSPWRESNPQPSSHWWGIPSRIRIRTSRSEAKFELPLSISELDDRSLLVNHTSMYTQAAAYESIWQHPAKFRNDILCRPGLHKINKFWWGCFLMKAV